MTEKDLTDVEKRFAEEWIRTSDVHYDGVDYSKISFFRELMKETAYHEAGHFVAKLFTNLELFHVSLICESACNNDPPFGIIGI